MKTQNIGGVIITLLLIPLLNGCIDRYQNHEQTAYYEIIEDLIDIDKYYMPAPPPGLIINNSEIVLNKLQNEYDSILRDYHQKVEALKKYMFVKDTLQAMSCERVKENVVKQIELESFTRAIIPKRRFNFDNYTTKDIKLIPISSFNNTLTDTLGLREKRLNIGYIVLSRILFNEVYTEGILICDFYCGKKCGESMLISISNQDGKWKIKERITLRII